MVVREKAVWVRVSVSLKRILTFGAGERQIQQNYYIIYGGLSSYCLCSNINQIDLTI